VRAIAPVDEPYREHEQKTFDGRRADDGEARPASMTLHLAEGVRDDVFGEIGHCWCEWRCESRSSVPCEVHQRPGDTEGFENDEHADSTDGGVDSRGATSDQDEQGHGHTLFPSGRGGGLHQYEATAPAKVRFVLTGTGAPPRTRSPRSFAPESSAPMAPRPEYRIWWSEVESCSGRTGNFDHVEWRMVPNSNGCYEMRCCTRFFVAGIIRRSTSRIVAKV
jgi:hypothetical protein